MQNDANIMADHTDNMDDQLSIYESNIAILK